MKFFSSEPIAKTSIAQLKWFKSPSRMHLIVATLIWVAGVIILIIEKTNSFKKSFFKIEYLFVYFIIVFSLSLIINMFRNYSKKEI